MWGARSTTGARRAAWSSSASRWSSLWRRTRARTSSRFCAAASTSSVCLPRAAKSGRSSPLATALRLSRGWNMPRMAKSSCLTTVSKAWCRICAATRRAASCLTMPMIFPRAARLRARARPRVFPWATRSLAAWWTRSDARLTGETRFRRTAIAQWKNLRLASSTVKVLIRRWKQGCCPSTPCSRLAAVSAN